MDDTDGKAIASRNMTVRQVTGCRKGRMPPFDAHAQLCGGNLVNLSEVQMLLDRIYLNEFLHSSDLEQLHSSLWFAGRRGNISLLHHHKVLHRDIILTESPRLHLIWFDKMIYVQRLPVELCNWDYFDLIICSNPELHRAATGFLWSYMSLVRSPPDLELAKSLGLIDKMVEWKTWSEHRRSVMTHLHGRDVHDRFEYGELRLSRLNIIYPLKGRGLTYFTIHRDYSSYFASNYASLIALFALVSVALSAFQVIAGIDGAPLVVLNTAYRFSVAALIGMMVSGMALIAVLSSLLLYHWVMTYRRRGGRLGHT